MKAAILRVSMTSQFKRDYKLAKRRRPDVAELRRIVDLLAARQSLPPKNRDHALHNNWEGFCECDIKSDWLLIYQVIENDLVLTRMRTGTHNDLEF